MSRSRNKSKIKAKAKITSKASNPCLVYCLRVNFSSLPCTHTSIALGCKIISLLIKNSQKYAKNCKIRGLKFNAKLWRHLVLYRKTEHTTTNLPLHNRTAPKCFLKLLHGFIAFCCAQSTHLASGTTFFSHMYKLDYFCTPCVIFVFHRPVGAHIRP